MYIFKITVKYIATIKFLLENNLIKESCLRENYLKDHEQILHVAADHEEDAVIYTRRQFNENHRDLSIVSVEKNILNAIIRTESFSST